MATAGVVNIRRDVDVSVDSITFIVFRASVCFILHPTLFSLPSSNADIGAY
jgi:hypothetical protein